MEARSEDPPRAGEEPARWLLLVALAAVLPLTNHLLWGRLGLNLRDEGYLWYGVRAVLAGELPLRDFQAYDPGRYFWCALFTPLFGDGVLGVRAATAVFQAIGLFAGLAAARRATRSPIALTALAVVLSLWMFPRHKLFESALTMIGVLTATRLVERPGARRHAQAGLVLGLAAFFGRNHGLYLALAFGGLALLLVRRGEERPARRFGAMAAGTILGYAPMLALILFAEGFASAFVRSTRLLLEQGANLPLPFPWPWRASFTGAGADFVGELGLVLAFMLPVVVYPLVLVRMRGVDPRRSAVALALGALAVGIPYAHHYSVRCDLAHLGQGLAPALLALTALPCLLPRPERARALVFGVLIGLTLLVQFRRHPLAQRLRDADVEYVTTDVGGDLLELPPALARQVELIVQISNAVGPGELLIAPTAPTFYPLMDRRSPDWWIYYLWPASEELQRETIRRLEESEILGAVIVQRDFEGDESYSFEQTNPLVWEYLEREFTRSDVWNSFVFFATSGEN